MSTNRSLNTTEVYFLTVLEARNQKSRYWQSHALPEGCTGVFLVLLPSGGPRHSLVCDSINFLCLCLHMAAFSLWVCVPSPLHIRTSVIGFWVHPNSSGPHLNVTKLMCKDPISQWGHILRFWSTEIWRRHYQDMIFMILSRLPIWGQSF